ncbi:MAG: rod shape-determining protein RodA [Gammaproteobacteria bacterium]|nr:rod shape-determining protein RodA [Gammaproteobacteria bacterium]MDH5728337.1 rod shape-determining protein RodA [Gammaproteobacteria bacterium]
MSFNSSRQYSPWVDRRQSKSMMGIVRGFHLDWPLFAGLLVLSVVGLFILYSASGQDLGTIGRQVLRLTMAFMVMLLIAQIPPHHLEFWTPWVFSLGIVLLLAVLLFGDVGKGAQRWLDLGLFRFQPSELMKIAVPMMVAWYLSEKAMPPSFLRILVALSIIVVPVTLIMKQPDLGTSLLVGSAGAIVLLLTGISWWLIGTAGILMAASAPVAWFYLMHDYQRQRVLTFLSPENDPLGSGYHIIQSKIAIGSGGIYGKGWLNGTQSQLDFLPERSTDFIFAVFAEEFGLIGILFLLSIFSYIVMRGLRIAYQAQDTYTRLLAGSLVLTFLVYVFVNIGMVSGLLPVVGVPLPLVSYGGTSMVTLMAAFGVLMSIHTHRKLLPS